MLRNIILRLEDLPDSQGDREAVRDANVDDPKKCLVLDEGIGTRDGRREWRKESGRVEKK